MGWEVEGGQGLIPQRCVRDNLRASRAQCVRPCPWAGPGQKVPQGKSQVLRFWSRNSHLPVPLIFLLSGLYPHPAQKPAFLGLNKS